MTESEKVEVAIVGGGIAGLCLAFGLLKNPKLSVNVYEATAEFKDVGAGLALPPGLLVSVVDCILGDGIPGDGIGR